MNNNIIFFITTPLQYLCALELKQDLFKSFKGKLYLFSQTEYANKQFEKIVDKNIWAEVHFFCIQKTKKNLLRSEISHKNKLKKYVNTISKDDVLVAGNPLNFQICYLLNKFQNNSVYIVDDGFATINIIYKKSKFNRPFEKKPKTILRKCIWNAFKLNNAKNFVVYTIYSELVSKDVDVLSNNLTTLKNKYSQKLTSIEKNCVCFIGQALVSSGIVQKEYFINTINALIDYFKTVSINFKYYTHRADVTEYPSHWNVVRTDTPIEVYFSLSDHIPDHFISFYSSALSNIKILLSNSQNQNNIFFYFIRIPENNINKKFKQSVNNVYDFISSNENKYGTVKTLGSFTNEFQNIHT